MGSKQTYVGPPLSGISSDWPIESLEDVCQSIFDCPHSTPKLSENGGHFMVRTQDIRKGYFNTSNAVRVSQETYLERTKRATPTEGDLLLSREGTYFGDAAEVPRGIELCLGQRMVLLRPNQSVIKSPFLRMWINSKVFQQYLLAFRDGTVAERLNVSTIKKLPTPVPPKSIQIGIINVLQSIERKQLLNRQMNRTLEAMAQAIFKSWFVDFGPVKAKQQARAAGESVELAAMMALSGKSAAEMEQLPAAQRASLAETAALFPERLVESELGLIPEGWELAALGSVANIHNGYAFKSKDYTDTGIFVLRTKNFDDCGLAVRRSDDVFLPNSFLDSHSQYISQAFDFQLVMVGASVGKTSLVLPHLLPALRNQNMWCFRPKDSLASSFFLNLTVRRKVDEVMSWASGSARSFFRKSDFQKHQILVPHTSILESFQIITQNLFEQIAANALETETLTQLRDTLLPKLLSGELTIPEAMAQTEEALS